MPDPFRVVLALVAGAATYLFSFWIIFALLPVGYAVALVLAIGLAITAAWTVWRSSGDGDPGFAQYVIKSALTIGGLSFLVGFIGPILLGAAQGPLLGLFVTGPVGLVVGAVVGAIRWKRRHRPPA